MTFYKKTAFSLLSLLIISCEKMRSEDKSNTDFETVQQTEIDNINNSTTQNNDSISKSDSLHQTATKGSILGEAKFNKKPKVSTAVQTNNTNPSNDVTETKVASVKSSVQMNFTYDGGGSAKCGLAEIKGNGEKVAEGRIEQLYSEFSQEMKALT